MSDILRRPIWLGAGLFPLIVVVSTVSVWLLSSDARREIDRLAVANSDNSQWSLAQIEVEFLTLHTAALQAAAKTNADTLQQVRNRFNIFYSRMQTIKGSAFIDGVASIPGVNEAIEGLDAFLERNLPFIDGDDATLRAALPSMNDDLSSLRINVRSVSLVGVRWFPKQTDLQRENVSGALTDLGIIASLLLVGLLAVVAVLLAMMRASQRQAAEISVAQNRLQAVVSTSLDAVLVVNQDDVILDYNGAAERIFGYSREEAIGARMTDLIVPEDLRAVHKVAIERHRKTGERNLVDGGLLHMEAKRKDGSVFPVEFSVNSARSAEGEIFVSFIRDISSRVANENELVDARDRAVAGEKAKADLLAVMSHEMRTPLNGVLGTLELLSDTNLDTRQRRYVEVMETSGKMLLEHVNDVLDISRVDAGKAKVARSGFDPVQLAGEVVGSLKSQARARGNKLAVEALSEIGMVTGDEPRIRQILFNLLGNAIKFTENGTVTVVIEAEPDSHWVNFRVIDTGIGINQDDLEKIFDDFVTLDSSYQREVEGTGLGLGIVRRLVELLGGEVGAESIPGDGSVFWFSLPLPAKAETLSGGVENEIEAQLENQGDCRVLVVEDNEINRMVVREMLLKHGCEVAEAVDGQEGVRQAKSEKFDLILMDISMPKMDGTIAAGLIREMAGPNSATPIMALTAHALPDDIKRFKNAGMSDVLTKPLSRQRLAAVLRELHLGQTIEVPQVGHGAMADLTETIGAEAAQALRGRANGEFSDGLAKLRTMLDEGQSGTDMAAFAHRLAGTAGLMEMTDLSAALAVFEDTAPSGSADQMFPLLDNIETEIERLS